MACYSIKIGLSDTHALMRSRHRTSQISAGSSGGGADKRGIELFEFDLRVRTQSAKKECKLLVSKKPIGKFINHSADSVVATETLV